MFLCKMPEKMYFNLLILCAILSEEISGILAEQDNKEPTDSLVREKRVIDNTLYGNQPVIIEDVPYIVQIVVRGRMHCAGSILSPEIVITCAHCVYGLNLSAFHILSGSANINMGTRHNVTRKIEDPIYRSSRYWDDLVLLVIFPPIDIIGSPNRKIELYEGPLPANEHGTVSSWGCIRVTANRHEYPSKLRSIKIPIIRLEQCQNFYRGRKSITSKNICTFDNFRGKRCSFGDSGAPLVVEDKLVGVHAWSLKNERLINPDVYMSMLNYEYRNWIMSNIASYLGNHQNYQNHQNHQNQHNQHK